MGLCWQWGRGRGYVDPGLGRRFQRGSQYPGDFSSLLSENGPGGSRDRGLGPHARLQGRPKDRGQQRRSGETEVARSLACTSPRQSGTGQGSAWTAHGAALRTELARLASRALLFQRAAPVPQHRLRTTAAERGEPGASAAQPGGLGWGSFLICQAAYPHIESGLPSSSRDIGLTGLRGELCRPLVLGRGVCKSCPRALGAMDTNLWAQVQATSYHSLNLCPVPAASLFNVQLSRWF